MARAENVQTISGIAGEVLPIYRFVQLQSDGQFDLGGAAGDDERMDAVTAEAAAVIGDTVALAPTSQPAIMKVEAGEAIAVGGLVAAAQTTGKALAASAAGAGNYSCGVALTAAGADGEIIEVLMHLSANQA